MADKQKIEIFSADCTICHESIEALKQESCSSCEVIVHDMKDTRIAWLAQGIGIQSVPEIVIGGELASCCADRGMELAALKNAGLGKVL